MMLDFRQRLLTTTLFVGVGALATPAFAQPAAPVTPPECPQGTVPGNGGACNPADTAGGTGTQPETTAPQEGQTSVPSTNANGTPVQSQADIVVTGTRIPQPNLTSASPVTVVTSQEIKLEGTTRTEDLINSLPQVFASQGSNISNGATGTATIDLRGLGDKRTLVLVNGKRLQPGDVADPVGDINFIPNQLIKRVDVLTGGASAVYGADAVAGVVNFVMDDTFTGLRLDAQASTFMHDNRAGSDILGPNSDSGYRPPHGLSVNGGAEDVAGVFGAAFDDGRGHVQAYATYRKQNAVLESSRDYSFCSLGSNPASYVAQYGEFYCGGSGTNANGRFLQFNPTTGVKVNSGYTVTGTDFTRPYAFFNYAPYNYYQRPDERYNIGGFANYEIAPGAKPYLEMMFMNDQSTAAIAPGGDFGNTTSINCDNPLLSAQERATICAAGLTYTDTTGVTRAQVITYRRDVEGGPRVDDLEHTAFRIVAGIRGNPLKGISYDAYFQFGKTNSTDVNTGNFSVRRLQNALDVVSVANGAIVAPGTAGATIECRSVYTGTDSACVPYNVFANGGVTQAALNYLEVPAITKGSIKESIAHIDATLEGADYGLQTPWSSSGIGLNVGAEYRKEQLAFLPDVEYQTGDLAGNGSTTPPVNGQFDVREAFAELQVPIIEKSFIEELSLDAGYRYSDYHVLANSTTTSTYKLEGKFAPVRDIQFRASYNRAVRAPNIIELFTPTAIGLTGTVDYCAGAADANGLVNGYTQQQCALTGVTAAQFGNIPNSPANQYTGQTGGNLDLKPEKADTWTAGLVIQPRWVPGFALTADYFNIHVNNVIGTLPYAQIQAICLNTGSLCNDIHRDQFGTLWATPNGYVIQTNQNVGKLQTRGIDLNASYARRLGGFGTLNISFVGTRLLRYWSLPFGGTENSYSCLGYYGNSCGTPNPKWRHKLRVGLTLPNGLGISGQWRYFGGVAEDTLSNNVNLSGTTNPADAHFAAQSYFDLTLTARVNNKLNLRLGAQNIFDRSPPLEGLSLGNGNTFPQVYDSLGRYVFAGATVDF